MGTRRALGGRQYDGLLQILMSVHAAGEDIDPRTAMALERITSALLAPMHEEIARRAGKRFSVRTGVPGLVMLAELSPIREFALMKDFAEAHEIVDSVCSRCGEPLQCSRLTAGSVACDVCRQNAIDESQAERHEKYWSQEHICPPGSPYRSTDPKHAGFPKVQYEATKNYAGEESFLFFGPTGAGKSRLAVHLGKRCLFKFSRFVGILWPEDLKQACRSYERGDEIKRWGKFDVLVMDDSLLTGAQDEKMADFLKDLLDYRLRHGRHQIITSQIGGSDYEEQLSKYAKARGLDVTTADKRRVDALLRRIRETCRLVPFAETKLEEGQQHF